MWARRHEKLNCKTVQGNSWAKAERQFLLIWTTCDCDSSHKKKVITWGNVYPHKYICIFMLFFLTTTTPEQTFYQSQTDCLKIWQENLSTRVDKQLLLAPLYPNCWLMSNLGDLRVYSWANSKLLSSLALQYAGGAMGWIMFQGGGVKGGKPLPPGLNPLSQRRARGDSWANYVELILHTPTGEGNLIGELAPFPSMGVSLREGTPTDRVPEPITNRAEQSLYMFFVHSVQTGRLREGTSLSSTTTVCYSWLKVR